MGVRTAERITGVSVFMADLQIGRQRSEALDYSASRRTPKGGASGNGGEGKNATWRRVSERHTASETGALHSFAIYSG
jgi:hypothetical protein